jgi:hypothetical protein
MIRLPTPGEVKARRKPFEDMNKAYRMGFSQRDLPKDRFGNLAPGYAVPGIRQNRFGIQKSADFLLGRGGQAIKAREKARFENLRKTLRERRIKDPLRTKTFTVREGGKDGVSSTFREPIQYKTAGQEILSNFAGSQLGSKMTNVGSQTASELMTDYGQRARLIGESSPTNLNPDAKIDFSRRLV